MRIAELHLTAFGHFTDRRLDLGGESELVVVYGANEAGKSTSLRGLETLLFGFERQAVDQHLHPKLQVGGVFETEAGQRVELVRRSGKEPLRSVDGQIFPEEVLRGWLRGVDRDLWRTLYGLDHARLREGAKALLDSKSSVAESLFDAGIAGAGVAEELKRLRARADGTFRPLARGVKKPALNEALKQFFEAEAQRVRNVTNYDFVEKQKEGIEAAQADRAAIEEQLRRGEREKKRLETLRRVAPLLARRDAIGRALAAVGVQPPLPAAAVNGEARRWLEELAELELRHGRLVVSEGALAAVLRALPEPLRSDAATQRELLLAKFSLFEGNARRREQLSAALPASPSPTDDDAEPVLTSEEERSLAERAREAAVGDDELARLLSDRAALADVVRHLASAPRATPEDLVAAARWSALSETATALEADARARARQARELRTRARDAARSLGLADEDALQPDATAPPAEWLDERAALERALVAEEPLARRLAEEARAEVVILDRELAELLRDGALPTEDELAAARQARDATVASGAAPAPVLAAIAVADALADTLRREAARASRIAALRTQRVEREAHIERRDRACAAVAAELVGLREAVREAVAHLGVPPLGVGPTIDWLRRRAACLPALTEARAIEAEAEALAVRASAELAVLGQALSAPGAGLAELRAVASTRADQARRARDRDERTEVELREARLREDALERRIAAARGRLEALRGQLTAELERRGLPADSLPEDVIRLNAGRLARREEARRREELASELAGLEREASELFATCNALRGRGADAAVSRADVIDLLEELATASRVEVQRQESARELHRLQEELEAVRSLRADRSTRLAAILAAIARTDDLTEPASATLDRAARAHELAREREQVEQQLVHLAETTDLERLARDVEAIDAESLDAAIEQRDVERDDLERHKERLIHDQRGYEEALRRVELESSRAAQFAETAEIQLARVKVLALDYVRHKLATRLLEREIQTYQDLHQGPVLRRAAEHFRTLTRGSFDDLRIVIGARMTPELVCVRDRREVGVEGLSDGAKDQLYLALRLATIERHGEGLESVPLVLDDVLVNFDEDRTRSALGVLRALGSRMQILLFTHLERTVELARAVSSDVRVALL